VANEILEMQTVVCFLCHLHIFFIQIRHIYAAMKNIAIK